MTNNGSIKQFAIKTAIVSAAIVISLWLTLDHLDELIDQRISQIDYRVSQITMAMSGVTKFKPREFWPRLEANIEKAADPSNDLSPERREKLIAAIRVLRERWKPFLDELVADSKSEPETRHK